MARKIKIVLLTLFLVCSFGATKKVFAYDVHEGTVSSTYITYFTQILNKEFNKDYIVFRSGQYTYTMLTGDIELNGSRFTSDSVKEYVFTTQSGYNSVYSFNVYEDNVLNMEVGSSIVYSNLGDYPTLITKGDNLAYATNLIISIFFVFYLLTFIFKLIF